MASTATSTAVAAIMQMGKIVKAKMLGPDARQPSFSQLPDRSSSMHAYVPLPDLESVSSKSKSYKVALPHGIICPDDLRYRAFWYLTIAAAAWTGVIKAYSIAFQPDPGLHLFTDSPAIQEYALSTIFLVDMLLKFRLAFREHEQLVGDAAAIRRRYLRCMFWVDLAALLPFDCAVLWSAGRLGGLNGHMLTYFQLARLLRLLRMYRVPQFFLHLEYKLTMSLLAVTLVRNVVFTYYSVHWSACCFYWLARQHGFSHDTWIGHDVELLKHSTPLERYCYAVYWSITTLATVGYGDFVAKSIPETVWSILYMFWNLGLSAYILGSFTLIVLRNDERVGVYRDRCSALKDYSTVHRIPKDLRSSMQDHLRLHFQTEEASDEAVLFAYPTTIRRRILRHLYRDQLRNNYLLAGCQQKFLDALLAVARVELYMPREDILVDGDFVNELSLVVAGTCEVVTRAVNPAHTEDVPLADDGTTSVHAGSMQRRMVQEGQMFGEVAFFTETPQLEGIRAGGVTRVLTVPRSAYAGVAVAFPLGARSVLENLQVRAQQMVNKCFAGPAQQRLLAHELGRMGSGSVGTDLSGLSNDNSLHSSNSLESAASVGDLSPLSFSWASPEFMPDGSQDGTSGSFTNGGSHHRGARHGMTPMQQQVLASAMRVRALVTAAVAKSDEQRTNLFLSAASHGNTDTILKMLQQGFDSNAADYDGRTGLMLAAAKGHIGVVRLLLAAKADVNATDGSGGTAVDEACAHGHDTVSALLVRRGGRLGGQGVREAARLCTAVFEGDLPLLRRLLRAGADANAHDYDRRTALHIAAAEGNLAAVRLLVTEGSADASIQDRWGRTALQEAIRASAAGVVRYLEPHGQRSSTSSHRDSGRGTADDHGGDHG